MLANLLEDLIMPSGDFYLFICSFSLFKIVNTSLFTCHKVNIYICILYYLVRNVSFIHLNPHPYSVL